MCSNSLPLVTIGVCVHNCVSTIREAIESIMMQDYPHKLIEVMFVDDGSEDETLAIIKQYASKMDMKVRIFHHKWKGLGPSRNIVVENASGKYIVWVDGDMIIPNDFVRKQVEFMEKNPKVGIAKAKYEMVSDENLVSFLENITFVVFNTKEEFSRLPGTGGAIFRTDAIHHVKGFDSSLRGVGEDQDIAKRIALAGWQIRRSNAFFHERRGCSWKELWQKYVWYGYGNFFLYQRHNDIFKLYKMLPLSGIISGLLISLDAYKIVNRKRVFLIPLCFVFKLTAWYYGFIKAALRRNAEL